jgi:hypothetical protein
MLLRIAFALLLAACSVGAKCSSTPGPCGSTGTTVGAPCDAAAPPSSDAGPSVGSKFAHCTTDAIKAAGQRLLPDIANAVATSNYETAIADLLTHFTSDEVKCGIELFIDSMSRKAAADPLAASELQRAQAWLAAHK